VSPRRRESTEYEIGRVRYTRLKFASSVGQHSTPACSDARDFVEKENTVSSEPLCAVCRFGAIWLCPAMFRRGRFKWKGANKTSTRFERSEALLTRTIGSRGASAAGTGRRVAIVRHNEKRHLKRSRTVTFVDCLPKGLALVVTSQPANTDPKKH
jgi:hypothetical protein